MRSLTKDDSGGISARVFNPAGEAGSQGFLLVQSTSLLFYYTKNCMLQLVPHKWETNKVNERMSHSQSFELLILASSVSCL